jgi:hypothetical protein
MAVIEFVVLGDGGANHLAVLDALLSVGAAAISQIGMVRRHWNTLKAVASRSGRSACGYQIEPKVDRSQFFSLPESRV